ncbi:MAG: beta-lactamase-like [uncultured Solirubrobacterales bacterium]|uniref:Beta-lactamase-like n=1 Tax=uncultured Solirubrobacterales bacterium TaxID=768556 RepID=A0A6J4THF4_9ACTN|nr:MAG: beta-lactamase-like [uncultured Solirubrobacterales bacterium]
MAAPRKRDLARADRVLPGLWRLRLPLPWPGVPHVNAYAIATGDGLVLVDTGLDEPGALAQLERALHQAGFGLEHVRLLVCTHAHPDHYGLAEPIVAAAGCELWMHPSHGHSTRAVQRPDRALERRIEVARHCGVPEDDLRRYQAERAGRGTGVAGVVRPDRDLVPGVEIETDLGTLAVHETPGHAPSHVVLHEPDSGLLISGDHLLGRIALYFDYGHTPDPAGEFLRSLEVVEGLDARLCVAGHGRPFRDVQAHVDGNRRELEAQIDRVRVALARGPQTPFELVRVLLELEQDQELTPMMVSLGLNMVLAYLTRLEVLGDAGRVDVEGEPERWEVASASGS